MLPEAEAEKAVEGEVERTAEEAAVDTLSAVPSAVQEVVFGA